MKKVMIGMSGGVDSTAATIILMKDGYEVAGATMILTDSMFVASSEAKAICDKLGYDLKVEDMEFDAIVNAVKSGKADFGAAGMTVTEDRKKSIDFTDPYTTAEQVIIVQK